MFNNLSKTKSVLLVAIMLVAAASPAMAAAPAVDTESTNTSTTSELTDTSTQAYNQTTNSSLAWSADSQDSKVVIKQGNDTLIEASPDHYDAADTDTSGSNDTWYFETTLNDDGSDYSGLDADAGESVTLNVTFTNDTTATNPDTTNISFTFANGNVEAFEDVSSDAVQTPAEGGLLSTLSFWSDNGTDQATTESKVGIAGNETETITQSLAGTPMADAMDVAAESTESGDVIWASAASLDGQYLVVANSDAPDTEWFNDSSAYATYDSDSQTLTYHNVDQWTDADAKDIDLSATGNDGLGLGNTVGMLQNYDAGVGAWTTAAWNADWSEPDWESDE